MFTAAGAATLHTGDGWSTNLPAPLYSYMVTVSTYLTWQTENHDQKNHCKGCEYSAKNVNKYKSIEIPR